MADEQTLNAFQQAGQEALAYSDAFDKAMTQGGKLAHEEIERQEREQAAAPPVDDQPTTEGSTPLEAPKPAEATTEADPWGALANGVGKWKDNEEAKKSYFHLLNLAKNAQAERDALRQRLEERSAINGSQSTSNGQPQVPDDPLKMVEDYGVPADVLGRAIDARADARLMAILAPMATQLQVDQSMADSYPDWQKQRAELNVFIESDPALKAQYHAVKALGTPEAIRTAEEFALYKFKDSRAATTEEALKANNEVRKELVDQARKDAGIVGSKRSEGREADTKPKNELTPERFEVLKARAQAGYENELWRETIGRTFPPGLFD